MMTLTSMHGSFQSKMQACTHISVLGISDPGLGQQGSVSHALDMHREATFQGSNIKQQSSARALLLSKQVRCQWLPVLMCSASSTAQCAYAISSFRLLEMCLCSVTYQKLSATVHFRYCSSHWQVHARAFSSCMRDKADMLPTCGVQCWTTLMPRRKVHN